jgi:integrase
MAQYVVYTAEGRKRKTLLRQTRADVTKKLDRPLSDHESGLVFDDKGLTVEEYLDRWLKNSDRDTVRNTTYERYKEIQVPGRRRILRNTCHAAPRRRYDR